MQSPVRQIFQQSPEGPDFQQGPAGQIFMQSPVVSQQCTFLTDDEDESSTVCI